MDESINHARAIFYDFFAGLLLRDLLIGREKLIQTQLESLGVAPFDEESKKSFDVLSEEIKKNRMVVMLDEYDDLFALPMTGEVVLPYVSHYKQGCLNGDILVDIRQQIKKLPVRLNREVIKETEDHFGFLFLVMRYCIEEKIYEEAQKEIFKIYIAPYVKAFIDDIHINPKAILFKEIATLLQGFLKFERHYIK